MMTFDDFDYDDDPVCYDPECYISAAERHPEWFVRKDDDDEEDAPKTGAGRGKRRHRLRPLTRALTTS
jgi:hypothetical protein